MIFKLLLAMAITFGAIGPQGIGATSLSVDLPSGVTAGDILVLFVVGRSSGGNNLPSATGFVGDGDNFKSVATGSDFICSCILTRQVASSESGSLSVSATNWTCMGARVLRYGCDNNAWTNIECVNGNDAMAGDDYAATNFNNWDPPDEDAGDMFVAVTGIEQVGWLAGNGTLTIAGLTFSSNSVRVDDDIAVGDQACMFASDHLAGSGSGSAAPDYSIDITNDDVFGQGVSVILRMREGEADTPKSVSDSATARATEQRAIAVALTRSDSATVEATEARTIAVGLSRPDSATVESSEVITIGRAISVAANATVRVQQIARPAVTLAVANSATVRVQQLGLSDATFVVNDSAIVRATESVAATVAIAVAAPVTVRSSEVPFTFFIGTTIPNSGTVRATEAVAVATTLSVANSGIARATETAAVSATLQLSNNATVRAAEIAQVNLSAVSVPNSATVRATEGISIVVQVSQISVSDSATTKATESASSSTTLTVSNTALIRLQESVAVTASFTVANNATARTTEAVTVSASIPVANSATARATETSVGGPRELEELTQMRFGLWGQLYGDFTRTSTSILVSNNATVRATEAVAITVTASVENSATVRASESRSLGIAATVSNSATVQATEARTITTTVAVADSATVRVFEGITVPESALPKPVADSAIAKATESLSISASVPLPAPATVRTTETLQEVVLLTLVNNATVRAGEQIAPFVTVIVAAPGTVRVTDGMIFGASFTVSAIATTRAVEQLGEAVGLVVADSATIFCPCVAGDLSIGVLYPAGGGGLLDIATVRATEIVSVFDQTVPVSSEAIWIPNERPQTWEQIFRHHTFTLPPRFTTWTPLVRKPGQPVTAA